MEQKEKSLLLQDLCARLPYGVKILHEGWDYERDDEMSTRERVVGIDEHFIYTKVINTHSSEEYRDDKHPIDTFDDKLFLRPMSSMTEEEKLQLIHYAIIGDGHIAGVDFVDWVERKNVPSYIDWLHAHHFDFRNLINKGLAIDCTNLNIY